MANGATVRLPPAPAPADVTSSSTAAGKPNKPIEVEIGEATAAAVVGIGCALAEYQNGGLTNKTRTANGTRIAALYELQQSSLGEINFSVVARERGRIALRQYLAASDFYRHYSTAQGDAVLDMLIGDVLAVVAKVTALEAAWAN